MSELARRARHRPPYDPTQPGTTWAYSDGWVGSVRWNDGEPLPEPGQDIEIRVGELHEHGRITDVTSLGGAWFGIVALWDLALVETAITVPDEPPSP